MSTNPGGFAHFATANDTGSAGAHAELICATVNTAAASAVLTIYNGTATTDPVVATINAATLGSYYFGGLRLGKGLFAKLTGGNADCTVGYR